MRDCIEIGPVPCEESCQQVGTKDYDAAKARQECNRFRDLIIATFGDPPDGTSIRIKSNPHDFGSYYEVAVSYDDDNADSVAYAIAVEGNSPATWDDTTKRDWRLIAKA